MTQTLRTLLTSDACDLPRKRDTTKSLVEQLGSMHTQFLALLRASDPSDEACKLALEKLSLIENLSSAIKSSVEHYLAGSPFQASTALRPALVELQPHLESLIAPRQFISNLYRVREIDSLANSERKDIFHVPFELRHRVNTQRYSISGWPSLYLGASLMVCWEEVGRPAFHMASHAHNGFINLWLDLGLIGVLLLLAGFIFTYWRALACLIHES